MPAIPLIAAGIGAAGTVAASAIQSHAASKATDTQLAASRQAQGAITNANQQANQVLGQTYRTQQANLSPYQALGSAALGTLGSRMGLNLPNATGQPSGSVRMRAPDGSVRLIPAEHVSAAQAAGGVPV